MNTRMLCRVLGWILLILAALLLLPCFVGLLYGETVMHFFVSAALSAFLGKITRNLSINRAARERAAKRGGGEYPAVLEELAELVSGGDDAEQALMARELARAIDAFLGALPAQKRRIFVCRYWYFDSVADIAHRFGMTEDNASVTLHRLRVKLRDYLSERGYDP